MKFVVDQVHEDSFYNNILLGLPKIIDKRKRIGAKGRHLTRYPAALPEEISAWEKRFGVILPHELNKFYSSTNGFLFRWMFNFGHDKNHIIGRIEINPLEKLVQVFGYETNSSPGVVLENDRYVLRLGLASKVFELAPVENRGKVVLVYIQAKYAPTIWFTDSIRNFYYITDDFVTYFRMAIAHLGIPFWQMRFSPPGPPAWTEILFRLIAPHLLPFDCSAEDLSRSLKNHIVTNHNKVNILNPDVFNDDFVLPTKPMTYTPFSQVKNSSQDKEKLKSKQKVTKHKKKSKF